jgi:hypothetical protein
VDKDAARGKQQGADAPRDLACPNRLGVARKGEYSRQVVVAQRRDENMHYIMLLHVTAKLIQMFYPING